MALTPQRILFGNPINDAHKVDKTEKQVWMDEKETQIATLTSQVAAVTGGNSKRNVPAKFAALTTYGLDKIYGCPGPLQAECTLDIEAMFDNKYTTFSGGTDMWVNWQTGVDTNDGSFRTPVKTVKRAMILGARIIRMQGSFSEEVPVWDAADGAVAAGTTARTIKLYGMAPLFRFRNPGQQPTAMTWTADVTLTNLWGATPAGGEVPDRIIWRKPVTVVDENGYSVTRYEEYTVPWRTSRTDANTSGYGWFRDTGTGKIEIRWADKNINTDKAEFEIIYLSATSAQFGGSRFFMRNIQFWGMTNFTAKYGLAGGTNNRPIVMAEDCQWIYGNGASASYGLKSLGAIIVLKNCAFLRNNWDGINCDPDVGTGQEPWNIEINCKYNDNGYLGSKILTEFINSFPATRNLQGASQHQGLVCRINGSASNNRGQNFADTQSTTTGGSWMIGCVSYSPRSDGGSTLGGAASPVPVEAQKTPFVGIELQSANTWVDTCMAGGHDTSVGLQAPNGAKVYNNKFDGVTAATVGTLTTYAPSAPDA